MSRSGYCDDLDQRDLAMWRGRVASAIRGKRGQRLLRELRDALDAMPDKSLIADELVTEDGDYCALGVLGAKRGIDLHSIDPDEPEHVAAAFDIAPCLAQEIEYMNDEYGVFIDGKWVSDPTPHQRWQHMREWVEKQIKA